METTKYTWYSDVAVVNVFVPVLQCIFSFKNTYNIPITITSKAKLINSETFFFAIFSQINFTLGILNVQFAKYLEIQY